MSRELVELIANMEEEEAVERVERMLGEGEDPGRILAACQEAMAIVGQRYEKGEYFLPELIMSGEMLKSISEIIKPKLTAQGSDNHRKGKVVLGTVRGDIHDIGKDIVGFMLDVNGFAVLDLGVDIPEDRFVAAVKEEKPEIVALSGFLTLAYDSMKSTIDALKEAGLRDNVKIMIGGGQITDMVCEYAGADAYGVDAMAAVALAKKWTGAD